ncbi:unnamed protein product [Adineta steineri]|uniref:Uncharacterized protein n=1 Tax=Adineta steineri TaxID=433720 RepID=A0A813UUN0_9BILA|nr:unnamed protein product [Adineta steineri]CAF3860026.1 unnamed protein product [Adineta steineri]
MDEAEEEEEDARTKKIQLFDELCNSQKTNNFPITDPMLHDASEILPVSFDEFYNDFANMFKTSLDVLQPLEDRLNECESILKEYTNEFFRQENDVFVPLKPKARSYSLSLDEIHNVDPTSELGLIFKRRKQIFSNALTRENEDDRETVENIHYKPMQTNFYNNRIFKAALDIRDTLNKVTSAQKFKDNFLHCWNKIVRSDTSQHILIDAFWWIYLKYFTKLPNVDDECEKYFTRIAKNYVELLLSVDSWFQDKFFTIYGSYLGQAIYQMFFDICPDSRMNFTDKFKEFIASTTSEWVTGIQATPETYKYWKIHADATMVANENALEQRSSPTNIYKKIRRLEEELEALGGDSGEETARPPSIRTPKRNVSIDFTNRVELENQLVDLSNQSTLVAWYFQQCDIQPNTPRLRNVERTFIKEWPEER